MQRFTLALASLTVLAAPGEISAQTQFPAKVVTDFGGLQDDAAREMTGISSIVRTTNGQFLVATAKPSEVRLFDATGKMLQRLGRSGAGPGEFRGTPMVRPWTGDSALTMSGSTRRWMLYNLNGTLVREWPVDSQHPNPVGTHLLNWAYTRTGTIGSAGCPVAVLAKLPVPQPWEPREALTDPAGRVWVRTTDVRWMVYSSTAALLGTITLPSGLHIYQFSGDLVVGKRYDGDDGEHVVVVQVTMPKAPAAAVGCTYPELNSNRARSLKTAVGNARIAGEAYRSDAKRYPTTVPPQYFVPPEDTETQVLRATEDSWVVLLKDKTSTLKCIFSMGMHGLVGWAEGGLACSM